MSAAVKQLIVKSIKADLNWSALISKQTKENDMNITNHINHGSYSQISNIWYWLGRGYSIKKAWKRRFI